MRAAGRENIPRRSASPPSKGDGGGASPGLSALADAVRAEALALGFDACGVAPAEAERDDGFDAWLDAGHHADMYWMPRTRALRQSVETLLPGCRSVVVVARNYNHPRPPAPEGAGKISRYAWGRDYHRVLIRPLRRLGGFIAAHQPDAAWRAWVDSGPVRERAWAARAGIGWVGKNSLILRRGMGSWFFLGALLTTAELAPDGPAPDRCGSCRACLDACPTGAIVSPRVVDANRCLAYHSIENRGEIPPEIQRQSSGWVFGCDICQEVCPWNREVPVTTEKEFAPRPGTANPMPGELAEMDEAAFSERFNGTPVRRAKLEGMRRNARMVLENPTA